MKHVVLIERKGFYRYPRLIVTVVAQVASLSAGRRYIAERVMEAYDRRIGGRMRQYSSMRIKEYRVVDAVGLKRLQAAAKASITRRRRLAAKKAAATRKRNRELGIVKPRPYYSPYAC